MGLKAYLTVADTPHVSGDVTQVTIPEETSPMRRFIAVFICLSALVLAQNVVAGTPVEALDRSEMLLAVAGQAESRVAGLEDAEAVGGEIPDPGTLMLLLTGLAGLAAVGGRPASFAEGAPSRFAAGPFFWWDMDQ